MINFKNYRLVNRITAAAVMYGVILLVASFIPNRQAMAEEVTKTVKAEVASDSAVTAESSDEITIIRKKAKIQAGKKYLFKAESAAGEEISWSVDKKDIASISKKGRLSAKRAGKVKVTAETISAKASCKVKVLPKKTVAIDAGHQQRANSGLEPIGPGASTRKPKVASGTMGVYTKVPEYKLTLAVAKKLRVQLVNRGYRVVMIRTRNNVNISNKERALKANETSDICIRIHADAMPGNSSVTGASALYPSVSNRYCGKIGNASKKLSRYVIDAMCSESGTKNRGLIVRNDLTGTNWSTIPVTLIEMGFMTNKAEDIRMQDPEIQEKIAIGMAKGVERYFGYDK